MSTTYEIKPCLLASTTSKKPSPFASCIFALQLDFEIGHQMKMYCFNSIFDFDLQIRFFFHNIKAIQKAVNFKI